MRKNTINLIGIFSIIQLFILGCTSTINQTSESKKLLINDHWHFFIDTLGYLSPHEINDDSTNISWQEITLPHTPKIEPKVVNNQWEGDCWYRKTVQIDPDWKKKKLFLRFEGAMNVAEVWVNGSKKIIHYGGYLPFVAEITDEVTRIGKADIYVKLNNEHSEITGPKPLPELDFNMYGGIYRDVYLLVKDKVFITDEQFAGKKAGGGIFIHFPKVDSAVSEIAVRTNLHNNTETMTSVKLTQQIKKEGKLIAEVSKKIKLLPHASMDVPVSLEVKNPELWSPQNPALYELTTYVWKGNILYDKQTTRIGIREFKFVENELYLNGEKTFLRGVNRHQEYPYIGYALSNNANFRDAYKIKEAGFDYVRLSHYPHSKSFMEACDELGLVVIDAILGWQYYRDYEPFKKHVLQTARDLIRRDRNHACVLAWEVSLNESWMPEEFIDSLITAAREEFPYENCYTAGWQKHGYDIYLQARQHRIEHTPDYPDKPYIVSEYGDWEYYALNAGLNQDDWSDLLDEERTSRQELWKGEKNLLQQTVNLQEAHNDNFTTPAVADGYWVMFDYNRGYANDLESSGIMSIFRLPKFSYYFFQSQRDAFEPIMNKKNEPMVFIANYFDESSTHEIKVFSNCDSVELFVNEKSLGIQSSDTGRMSENLNHPPFTFSNNLEQSGSLSATGYLKGNPEAHFSVKTHGVAQKLIVEADISGKDWKSGCKDAIFVYAKVVDQNNQLVYNYDKEIRFTIEGNAYGVGNLDPKPEAGVAGILVIADEKPGLVEIKAESNDLIPDTFEIQTTEKLTAKQ